MDYLSHVITDHVNEGSWKALRAGRNRPNISHLIFVDDLLLFAEASSFQMQIILNCLDIFCSATSHKVNPIKTTICFSKNVTLVEANNIARCGGFSVSQELGRYLGAHIHHGRATANNFKNILDRVHSWLNGWKQQCLSIAGRITLANSVLGSLATFQMQHDRIPKAICSAFEKAQRQFVWGG